MAQTLYLAKANNDGICHCQCENALISWPPQMDCPWCGCGWLFTCMTCRKAFMFAKPVRVPETLEDLARREHRAMWKKDGDDETIAGMAEAMEVILEPVEDAGGDYVYFDGYVLPVELDQMLREGEEPLEVAGMHRDHVLSRIPHLEAMETDDGFEGMLGSTEYWVTGAEEREQADAEAEEEDQ